MNLMRSSLTMLAALILTLGWSLPASAGEVSYCGVERLTDKQMNRAISGSRTRNEQAVLDSVNLVAKLCKSKVSAEISKRKEFRLFAYSEVMEFSLRRSLIGRGYDMDAVDRRLNMQCHAGEFSRYGPTGTGQSGYGPSALGARLIDSAEVDASMSGRRITGDDRKDLGVYITAQSRRWQIGQQLLLLPACPDAA